MIARCRSCGAEVDLARSTQAGEARCPDCGGALEAAAPGAEGGSARGRLAPGSLVLGCRIERLLGEDSLGLLYAASREAAGTAVGVRVLQGEGGGGGTFKKLAALDHPHIARFTERGEEGALRLLLSDFADALPLCLHLPHARFSSGEAAVIGLQTCAALLHAARAGWGHGALGSLSLLWGRDGNIRVAEIGLRQLVNGGEVDPRDDARGVARLLSWCLTGRWPGSTAAPPSPPREWESLLARFSGAEAGDLEALSRDLERILAPHGGVTVRLTPPPSPPPLPEFRRTTIMTPETMRARAQEIAKSAPPPPPPEPTRAAPARQAPVSRKAVGGGRLWVRLAALAAPLLYVGVFLPWTVDRYGSRDGLSGRHDAAWMLVLVTLAGPAAALLGFLPDPRRLRLPPRMLLAGCTLLYAATLVGCAAEFFDSTSRGILAGLPLSVAATLLGTAASAMAFRRAR